MVKKHSCPLALARTSAKLYPGRNAFGKKKVSFILTPKESLIQVLCIG